ncbi:MAG: DNA repair protein RadC [Campylobacterales bacterium]
MKKLHELYDGDKPREKLLAKGPSALKDFELMAVMLGSGVPGKDVLKLSREIVSLFETQFDTLDINALTSVHGMGKAKAAQILASVELCRRHLLRQNVKIASASDVSELLREYALKKQEYFVALTLDGASHLIEKRVISIGTLNQSLVHPREVFADAVTDRAAGVIVAHNHPGGQLAPSREDITVTRRLKEAGALLGIELLDHVILTKEGFLSLREEGVL